MRRPIILWRRGDVIGALFGALVLVGVIYLSVTFPRASGKHMFGDTRGPEWTCQYVANGEPVCIKDVPKKPAN